MRPSTLKRLERFNRAIEILEKLREKKKEVFVNDLWLTSVAERNIQIITEFVVDVSNFIISRLGAKIPESYKETIERIHKLKIVDENLKEKAIELVGLRNLIVHLYAEVKYDLIFDNLEEIIEVAKKLCEKILKFCEEKKLDP